MNVGSTLEKCISEHKPLSKGYSSLVHRKLTAEGVLVSKT